MAQKTLVIVESPTKARTITKFLPKGYIVKASNGHVRDLPNSASEIPANLKKEAWTKLGVNVEDSFQPLYVVPPNKKEHVKKLKDALKDVEELYLATDEDREGESISWHLLETLKPKVPVKRLVFHEITKDAIQKALNSPREVDENLVRAQETRRIIDRLFGYEVSPVLWKKMARGLSAGRVQSVAVRLLVEREQERIDFISASYWGLKADFNKSKDSSDANRFEAELTHVDDKRVAVGKDFNQKTGKLSNTKNVVLLDGKTAKALQEKLLKETSHVHSIEEKPFTTKPSAPFVTSTLQQEGNRKLRFSARHTMSIAQQLYENGFITYMRTDSTTLSQQAVQAARSLIENDYGNKYLPKVPRVYQTKVKNAQEAHEAIRPAGDTFASIDVVKAQLGIEAAKLYELIWKRTVASQMNDAQGTYVNVQISCGEGRLRASGKTILFPGFLRAYVEGSDDPQADLADQERILPKLEEGEVLKIDKLESIERSTQAPSRFTEGSIIKELERLGIGRPSTWATIVELVLNRSYAFKKGNALVPTFTACAVVRLLKEFFPHLLDYAFTARLEDDLDAISRGEAENLDYLKNFYFGNGQPGLKELVVQGEEKIDPRLVCGIGIGKSEDEREIEVRIGRYGPFITDGETRTSVPDRMAPDELTQEEANRLLEIARRGPQPIGTHPETKEPIYLKVGPYGPYVQQGDAGDDGEKPKMSSLLPGISEQEVTLELALKLLSLPRNLGPHPETKEEIIVANGRYGPYVKSGDETRSVSSDDYSILELTAEQAIAILKEPKRRGRGSAPKALRDLGAHPVTERGMVIKSGRYGPYVTDGEINASLTKGMDPNTITVDDAVNLLEARAAKIAAQGGISPKKTTKKKAATKKAKTKATKKTSAKKTSSKKKTAKKEKE